MSEVLLLIIGTLLTVVCSIGTMTAVGISRHVKEINGSVRHTELRVVALEEREKAREAFLVDLHNFIRDHRAEEKSSPPGHQPMF